MELDHALGSPAGGGSAATAGSRASPRLLLLHAAAVPTPAVLAAIHAQRELTSRPIFNGTRGSNDRRRLQADLSWARSAALQVYHAQLGAAIAPHLPGGQVPTDAVVLTSLPGCAPQRPHCDYTPTELAGLPSSELPWAALVALQDATRLRVWPSASVHDAVDAEAPEEELHMDSGDVCLFRGDLVHAGSGFADENVRLHVFLDAPAAPHPRRPNGTYLVGKIRSRGSRAGSSSATT